MFVRSWFHFTIIFVSLHSVAISSTIPTITKVETTVLQVRDEVIITRDPITLPHATITNEPITLNLPPKCVQTDIPDSNGFVPVGTCGSNYNYYPSFGAAVAASILFGIVTVVHIVQAASYKKVRSRSIQSPIKHHFKSMQHSQPGVNSLPTHLVK
jgi:hypothetical protein